MGDLCSLHVAFDDSSLLSPSTTFFSLLIYATIQPPSQFSSLGVYTDGPEYGHSKSFATETS